MSALENKMNTLKSEKLAFYKWIHKWVTTKDLPVDEGAVDVPQIAAVLQAMGYKLETVEHVSMIEQSTDTTKIEVQCNKSGMRAILSKQLETCICPSSEKANQSQFWAVSGTGPSCSQDNLNRVEETRSTLIPILSKEKTMLVRDILSKLFAIISDTDINQNAEINNSSWSRGRSLSDLTKPALLRQNTWETDLKITPPLDTSSPIPELSKSISQISLNTDKEQMLADILLLVKDNLNKALVLLPNKCDNTFTKPNARRVPRINFSPKVTAKSNENQISDFHISSKPASPPKLIVNKDLQLNKTPFKLELQQDKRNTPNKISTKTTEKRQIVNPSKFGILIKKVQTPNKSPVRFVKKDTPIPTTKKLTLPQLTGIPDRRSSLGTYTRNSSIQTNLNFSGCSAIGNYAKVKTGIPSFGFKSPSTAASKTGVISPFKKPK